MESRSGDPSAAMDESQLKVLFDYDETAFLSELVIFMVFLVSSSDMATSFEYAYFPLVKPDHLICPGRHAAGIGLQTLSTRFHSQLFLTTASQCELGSE